MASRDAHFITINRTVRESLVTIMNGGAASTCVPLQGSGAFAVKAMLGTLLPRDGRLLILANGVYGPA